MAESWADLGTPAGASVTPPPAPSPESWSDLGATSAPVKTAAPESWADLGAPQATPQPSLIDRAGSALKSYAEKPPATHAFATGFGEGFQEGAPIGESFGPASREWTSLMQRIGLSPTTKNWNAFNTLTGMLVNNIGAPVAGSVAEAVNLTSRVFEGVVKGGIDAGAQVLKNFGVESQQANDIARDALGPLEIEAGRGGEIPLHEAAQTAREFTAARNVNAPIPQIPKPKATPADVMAAPDIDTAIAKASEAAQAEPYDIEAEGMKAEAAANAIEQAAPAPVAAETPQVEPAVPEATAPATEAPATGETEAPPNEEIPPAEAPPEEETPEEQQSTAPAFDRLKYLGKARGYVMGRGSLKPDAVAQALGIEPEQAAQVMGALAAQRDSGLIVTANGTLRRSPTYSGPMDLVQWIGRNGGIARDSDMEAMDAHRVQTGAGPLARASGVDADYVREAVNQEGYGPYQTINDLYKAIDENLRGNRQFAYGEAPEERPYDPTEHEHYLDQRGAALGIERNPAWTLPEYDAAITEAEARRTPTHTLPEVEPARQAEISTRLDDIAHGLLDEPGLEEFLGNRGTAEARAGGTGEDRTVAQAPEPVPGSAQRIAGTGAQTESRPPDVAASGAASGTGEAGNAVAAPKFALADTPEFKNWFGNSAATDEDGNPGIFYHGSNKRFSEFEPTPSKRRNEYGGIENVTSPTFFFSPDRDTARMFARDRGEIAVRLRGEPRGRPEARPFYLSVQDPLDFGDGAYPHPEAADEVERLTGYQPQTWEDVQRLMDDPDVVKRLQAGGYDGVRILESNGAESWGVFSPTQIKSIHNRGAFDPNDPRIMFARDAAQRARDADQFTGREFKTPEGTTLRYTPAFESARAKVGESLRAELERRGLGSIAVRMADSIRNGDLPANGYYLRKVMTVALQSTSDHMVILDHEVIHALRDPANGGKFGLFTRGEWRILEAEARRKWLNDPEIAERLKLYADKTPAERLEEAIAMAAERGEAAGPSSFAARIFLRLRDFFRALGNALKGNGFATPESIFRGIREGEFGERLKQGEGTAEPKFAMKPDETNEWNKHPDEIRKLAAAKYPIARNQVDGLRVRSGVPNMDSIGATFKEYALLPDIREVPFSDFSGPDKPTDRVRELAEQIRASGEIRPLIVGIDKDGPWIIEGAHRYDALQLLGHKSFPAKVAVDLEGEIPPRVKPVTTEPGALDARGKPLPQTVMPGMEGSARQLQAAKGTESKIKPSAPQKEAGGLFAAKEPPQADLFGTKPKFAMRGEEEQIHDQVSDLIRAAAGEGAGGGSGKGPSITERDLPRIALAGIKQVKNLNLPESGTIFPRTLASLDDLSAKLWNAWGKKTEKANANVEQLRSVISDSLTQLPAESRDRVYAAIELARKWNWRPADNDAPIRVKNSSYWQAQKSKIGDDFVLSPAEAKAFRDTLKLGDDGWRMFMQALARREGWTGEVDPQTIREAANSKSALPEGKKLLRLANALESAQQAMNRPYFPAARFGDYYIAVRPKSGVDKQSLGGFPEVEWFQTVEGSALDNMLGRSRKAPENVQAVNDAIAKIRAITKPDGSIAFPEETHSIETGDLHRSSDTLRQLNIPAIEKLFMLMERGVTENLTQKIMGEGDGKTEARTAAKGAYEHLQGEAKDALLDAIYEDLQAGFKKQARLVPGYDADFDRAIGSHLGHIARNAADMEHREEIDSAYQNIQDNHPHQAVKDYWRHWREYQESPRASLMGPIGSMSRLGATYVMGLNPSTTLMISAHTPMMAAPVMGVGGNMGQATIQLMRSLREAYGAVTFDGKAGASIASENLGKNAREKALIAELDKAGLTHSTGADDVRAINDRQAGLWGKAAPTMKKALDISMSNISVVDQANRNAIALATFRMALNKPTLEKMAAPWMEHNAIFRDMVIHDGLTPENFTKFMLSEAAGSWGRTNQAHVMRGAEGSLLFALHGFQTRYLSTVFKLAKNMGPEGKIAAGWMMAALWFGAGAYGLPFTQDLETAGDALLKRINGVDPMIDAHIRQFLSDVGFGKIGTEVLLRGPLSVALGTDLSSRIGFGDVITRISGLSDFMGTIPSIVLGRLNAAYDRERNGQGMGAALAELLPSALRNPVRAAIESSEGALSATGRKELAAHDLSTGDTVRRAIGLPPMSVEQAYARNEYLGRLSKRDQGLREQTVNSAAQMILHSEAAAKNGDAAQAKALSAKLSELLSSYNKAHWQAPVTSPELSNAILQLTNPELARKIKMPRALAGETWANPYP